jgi:hypothetical protein
MRAESSSKSNPFNDDSKNPFDDTGVDMSPMHDVGSNATTTILATAVTSHSSNTSINSTINARRATTTMLATPLIDVEDTGPHNYKNIDCPTSKFQ